MKTRTIFALTLSSVLFSCSDSAPKLNPNLINANQGGTVSSQNGILEIPAGALGKNTEIMVKDQPDSVSGTPPTGVKKVLFTTQSISVGTIDANSISIVENTLTLNKPVTWKSKWKQETLGGIPENLALFQVKGGQWIRLDNVDIDLKSKWCKIEFKGKIDKSLILVLGLVKSGDDDSDD
jgi:hypothetical protein